MLIYIYDGSFEGMITSVKRAIKEKAIPERIICESDDEGFLFAEKIIVQTNNIEAEFFIKEIVEKFSYKTLQNIIYAYLSEEKDIEKMILDYILSIFQYGQKVNGNLTLDPVLKIYKVCQRVKLEAHRLKGLLRFRKLMDNVFYAPVEPDNDVIKLIAPHFTRRLKNEKWMIHDIKRNIAIIYQGINWQLVNIEGNEISLQEIYDTEEKLYQELWKTYFQAIAISERRNPKLQKRLMPKRYWKYLIEKEHC